jgi:hypothetical protein
MKPKNFERETEGGGYAGTAAGGQRDSRRGLGESLMSAPIPDEDPLRKKERMNLRYDRQPTCISSCCRHSLELG